MTTASCSTVELQTKSSRGGSVFSIDERLRELRKKTFALSGAVRVIFSKFDIKLLLFLLTAFAVQIIPKRILRIYPFLAPFCVS